MNRPPLIAAFVAALILLRLAAELALSRLNQRHVRAHRGAVPEPLRAIIDESTYARSVAYTLAKSRFVRIEDAGRALILLIALFSGVLPGGFNWFQDRLGTSTWSMAAFLFTVMVAIDLPTWPLDWFADFHIERRFGFNTKTSKIWWTDQLKSLLISALLAFPLLVVVLTLFDWTGRWWWLLAWAALALFQVVVIVLAPVLILPLFNRFTPLPEGSLRERLLALARRTRFRAQNIEVMDGSRRSHHSNAFFTGLGRFRKIVLFDTLIRHLDEAELEAVLAHEIGHYKLRHVPKLVAWSLAITLAGLWIASRLQRTGAFYRAFGFAPGPVAPALLLLALLAGTVGFWVSPLGNWLSRRREYQADAFAAAAMRCSAELVRALRKLTEKNLANLTPHPLYSLFYDSHPPLLARERALARVRADPAAAAG